MRILSVLTVSSILSTSAIADGFSIPSGTYLLDPTHASLVWKVSHFGLSNYTGRFDVLKATLELDAENPAQSTLAATIDPQSLSTGYPFPEKEDFDAVLKGEKWFNVAAFPDISFVSSSINVTGGTTGTMTGDLTFMGVTKSITLDVALVGQTDSYFLTREPAVGFSATGLIDRLDFGFSTFAPNIGADVELQIEAEFIKQ